MSGLSTRAARLIGVAALCTSGTLAVAQTPTTRIVSAANAFLATLDETQRKNVSFAFDDEQQRSRWSNFPQGIFKRAGLPMGELNPTQRSAAMALVSAALRKRGFEKVPQIVDADEVLKSTDRGNGRLLFGKDLYYISILGTPSEKTPWMLQFGGHHLALNITIAGERGILTPSLTGAQPALYTANGKTVRPLGQESDKALALLNALDSTQRSQAILNYRVADLVLVLATIDTDRDGAISAAEQRSYAARVLRDVSLRIDGDRPTLRLISSKFSGLHEMQEGRGAIQLDLEAAVPRGGPERTLSFENRHLGKIGVYLVNGLVPTDPDIHYRLQSRNYEQTRYQLDYVQAGVAAGPSWSSWLVGAIGMLTFALLLSFARLMRSRRRPTNAAV